MKARTAAGLAGIVLASMLAGPTGAVADEDSRSLVFRTRFSGLFASATWTTCPTPSLGDVCTDTILFAFNSKTTDGKLRDRGPVVRTLTFVYRVVGGEIGAAPIAEWFGRTEDATVDSAPRLEWARAVSDVPVLLCSVFDTEAGFACPESVPVDVAWTGTGELERIDDHTVRRDSLRMENTWTRGWSRLSTAEGTVGDAPLGTLVGADLTRADQGEVIVQHPFD